MKARILIVALFTVIGGLVVACGTPALPAPASRVTTTSGTQATTSGASNGAGTVTDANVPMPAGMQMASDRIGVAPLKEEGPLGQPNVARDPSDVPAPINRTENTTVEVNLQVKEVRAEIADGAAYDFWTFNGTVPGPMVRVMEGDTVKLNLSNPADSGNLHNIDLHAVNGPGGGAAVTNVAPGETKTLTFKALNPGAYIYHCAYSPPWHHIAMGMYGVIVVEPKGGLAKVDREFYVVQGEWYTTGKMGDKGLQEFSEAKALAEQPEYFTMNGRVDALTTIKPLQANVGETVRIFFGVGGPNVGSNFHLIGEIWDKVYSGSPETAIKDEETWYVPPGSAAIFEFKLNEPGKYTLVDHALWRVAKGAVGVLNVDGQWDDSIYSPSGQASSH